MVAVSTVNARQCQPAIALAARPQALQLRGQLHVLEEREAEQVLPEATQARCRQHHDNVKRMSCIMQVWSPA